jgi:hypothetical protein
MFPGMAGMPSRRSEVKYVPLLAALAAVSAATCLAAQNPEERIHPGFSMEEVHPDYFQPKVTGMDFLSDGRMVVSTWKPNEVYLLKGINGPRNKIEFRKIADGLKEVMGVCVVHDTIYLADQDAILSLSAADKDGTTWKKAKVAGLPFTNEFHEWSFGLVKKGGRFYTGLSVAASATGATLVPQKNRLRGSFVSVDANGTLDTVASGLRAPDGLCMGPDSELFVTDNQGSWLPASKLIHIVQGRTYGHHIKPAGAFEDGYPFPPAVWLPYGEASRSPTQPVYLEGGPYAGQFLYGDIAMGTVRRVFIEKIEGEYQGCVLRFSGGVEAGVHRMIAAKDGSIYLGGLGNGDQQDWGWNGKLFGLQRLKPNGHPVFEIKAMRSRPGGFELEFTQPVNKQALETKSYSMERWWYEPTAAYGGPKQDVTQLRIASVKPSSDGKRVFVEVDGLLPQQVFHLRLNGVRSDKGEESWTPESWYTLNNFSKEAFRP